MIIQHNYKIKRLLKIKNIVFLEFSIIILLDNIKFICFHFKNPIVLI